MVQPPITEKKFPIWHHNKEIPTGTLQKIKKEAGI
jgi:predicted RNA binding protein YcfA (HicA-like mRNA interferase family)